MNYNEMTRTNYFKITDEEKFKEICNNLCAEDNIDVEVSHKDGQIYGYIGCPDTIMYVEDDEKDYSINDFFHKLQNVLAEDDAVLWTVIGWEGMRFLAGDVTVITKNEIRYIDLEDKAFWAAREILNDPNWTTQNDY